MPMRLFPAVQPYEFVKLLGCYSRKVANVVARTIGRMTDRFTKHVAQSRKFGRKFTTYLQLSYADRKFENLTDNQQLRHLYTCYRYLPTQITLEKHKFV